MILAKMFDGGSSPFQQYLQTTEGPLRDFDLLVIGIVLLAVLAIRLMKRVAKGR